MLRMLVAVDGSDGARRAIEAAARLAGQAPVDAVLLNVREGPGFPGALPPFDEDRIANLQREAQTALLDEALQHARRAGLERVTAQAEVGEPAAEIARVAMERSVDMVVMGTRGLTALGGLLMGSVAQRVVHLATMPVLLVR
jgi:nucleotide-binding universal stress UspA family protein